ncbi:MAG: tRNA pseudouridine(55) synthase TruB [Bacillota bacterium]
MNGIVVVNKSADITSHQVVQEARKLFPGVRVGHSGTLDPMATGILPVCLGKATRVAEYVMELPKTYRAGIALGENTDTEDRTGEVLEKFSVPAYERNELEDILRTFVGKIKQTPPAYSAVKYRGKPLYHWTRQGRDVPRQDRTAWIYQLDLLEYNPRQKPHLLIEVKCSRGTYIRTLAVDIGKAAGCGGHLYSLKRTAVGPMNVDNALSLTKIKELLAAGRYNRVVMPMDIALRQFSELVLAQDQISYLKNGRAVVLSRDAAPEKLSAELPVRIYDQNGYFRALARLDQLDSGIKLKTLKFLSD